MSLGIVLLAGSSLLVCARSIEIAEAHKTETVRVLVSFQRLLEHQFGNAVRIHWYARIFICEGNLHLHAIHGARGRKNKLAYIIVHINVQHRQSTDRSALKIYS